MSGATATVNRSLAFDGGLAASAVGAAGAGAVTRASSGEGASGAELSEPSTAGSVPSRVCSPSRFQSSAVATSPTTRATTSTTLGRTRPYGRLALQYVIGDRVYVSTDGERQESRT